jgi:hypothetical protein
LLQLRNLKRKKKKKKERRKSPTQINQRIKPGVVFHWVVVLEASL